MRKTGLNFFILRKFFFQNIKKAIDKFVCPCYHFSTRFRDSEKWTGSGSKGKTGRRKGRQSGSDAGIIQAKRAAERDWSGKTK